MATLNGGIGANDELIRVSGTAPAPGTYFTIGSEAFKANGVTRGPQGRNFTRDYLAVDRGVAGTTKATHSNGASLTPYYPDAPGGGGGSISATDGVTTVDPATSIQFPAGTLSDAGGGVAAVGYIVQRIGPFHIAFDDPDITGDGVTLATLPAGSVVLNVWPEITVQWAFDVAGGNLFIGVGADFATVKQYVISGTYILVSVTGSAGTEFQQAALGLASRLVVDGPLLFLAELTNWTAGEADIYAIVATPAS